jgi:murein DD-endopeptidase MepM/ murein hydrolase activator NlpD
LDSLSRRYGVPSAALLSANGLTSPAEVKSGMRIIVPVYNAGSAHAVAAAASAARAASSAKSTAESPTKRRTEVASNDREEATAKAKKLSGKGGGNEKTAEKGADKPSEKANDKLAEKSKHKASEEKVATAPAKTVVAKAEPAAPPKGKKPAIDDTPTGNVDPRAAGVKDPVKAAEADASGGTPEFRWPARGRIIEGFKSGGNDGINISVPAGTSVRAAESGVVVYAGDGLKGYGNLVLIKHPNGFVTAYANNGELDVKRGEQVKRGQIIAKSGDTGNVNAPQLHFELRKGSTPVDPTQYLAGL